MAKAWRASGEAYEDGESTIDDTTAVVGWWPVAIFAVIALAAGAVAVHGWGWPL